MAYTTINKSTDYFNTTLWTGDGNSTQNITGTGFNADWIWLKGRSGAGDHQLYDKVRGVQKMIISNGTNAESTNSIGLQTFGSDGFTMGSDMTGSGSTFVSWNWLANGAGSSNTEGDITATVSANTTSGFSIIKFTSAGSVSQTYGHGLNGTPKLWIIKDTSQSSNNWQVYYNGTDRLKLDTTEATSTTAAYLMSANATTLTTPSNSDSAWGNGNGINYITYAFQEIQGFSKIGKYTGNGNADGSFIYTGFKPAYVLTKRSDTAESWVIQDNKQSPYNPTHDFLLADTTGVPTAGGTPIDILSNGFKVRTTSVYSNASGGTYIYLAFAEAPLVSSNGIPAVAR
jgi:hypothetical protein